MSDILKEFKENVIFRMRTYDHPMIAKAVAGLGVSGEAGEVGDIIKKHIGHDHDLDLDKLEKECGDVEFYLEMVYHLTGLDKEKVLRTNIKKLQERYPNGFDVERSKIRT